VQSQIIPLKKEISQLKIQIKSIKRDKTNIENEPLSSSCNVALKDRDNITGYGLKIGSGRTSDRRNVLRDTKNFIPLKSEVNNNLRDYLESMPNFSIFS
jgi:hypothetical protein